MTNPSEPIRQIAALLKTSHSAVAFTGAGVSTPSGIPDFRDPESGLWSHTDPFEVASIYGFRQNPSAFYNWVYPLAQVTFAARPNAAHQALAALEQRGQIHGVITQNIDMLHSRAGSKAVYEIHGNLREATCTQCFTVYPGEPILRQFLEDHQVPHCPKCGAVIKPNVILFGEQLPYREIQAAQLAVQRTDLMLIIGSSLAVAPASDLPLMALRSGAKLVIINLTPTDFDRQASLVMHANAAEVLPAVLHCLEEIA